MAEFANSPTFKLFYTQGNGKAVDITTDISSYLIDVRYLDRMYNETDELQIRVQDSDNVWIDEWYPKKGDKLKLQMGYNDLLVDCGLFEIDEITITGPPSVMTIKALATWVTSGMRTIKSFASDGLSIKDIAQRIADENKLKIVGKIYNVRIARSSQFRETDLQYLNRLGIEYGFVFSVRNSQLIFTSIYDQEDVNKNRPVYSIDLTDLISYSFRDTTSGIYNKAVVSYNDPKTGALVQTEQKADQAFIDFTQIKDYVTDYTKTEDAGQANLKARATLHKYNTKQQQGSITVTGYPLLVAGNNIEVTGLGKISGDYHIISSEHIHDFSGGYTTSLEVKRIGFIEKEKSKPKKAKKNTQDYVSINATTVG